MSFVSPSFCIHLVTGHASADCERRRLSACGGGGIFATSTSHISEASPVAVQPHHRPALPLGDHLPLHVEPGPEDGQTGGVLGAPLPPQGAVRVAVRVGGDHDGQLQLDLLLQVVRLDDKLERRQDSVSCSGGVQG